MKRIVLGAVAACSFVIGAAVSAQVVERVWDNGSVWVISKIDVKPGQYNAYIKYLRDVGMPRVDYGRKAGDILSYRVLSVQNVRDGEPDILVLTEYKNMAVFDRGPEFGEDMNRKLAGSLESRQAQMSQLRGLSDSMGSMMAREVVIRR
ncbi:MAG: hypothetical protein ACR2FK_05025 [Sphingomicrobium sp.]